MTGSVMAAAAVLSLRLKMPRLEQALAKASSWNLLATACIASGSGGGGGGVPGGVLSGAAGEAAGVAGLSKS